MGCWWCCAYRALEAGVHLLHYVQPQGAGPLYAALLQEQDEPEANIRVEKQPSVSILHFHACMHPRIHGRAPFVQAKPIVRKQPHLGPPAGRRWQQPSRHHFFGPHKFVKVCNIAQHAQDSIESQCALIGAAKLSTSLRH